MKIDLYKCIYRWVLCSMFWGRAAELDLNPLDLALSFFSTNMSEEPPTGLFYPSNYDLQSPNIQISSRKFVCPTTKYDFTWFHQPKTMDVACLLPKLSPQNDQNGWVDTSTPTKTCLLLIQRGMFPICHHPTWFQTQKCAKVRWHHPMSRNKICQTTHQISIGLWSLDYVTILNSLAILGPRNANPNPISIIPSARPLRKRCS